MLGIIKNIWKKESSNVTSAAILVGAASLASRLAGLLRDRLLAAHFGAGEALDTYYAAFKIPDLFFQLLVLGAVTAGFIPLFLEFWEKRGEDEARAFSTKVFVTTTVILMVVTGVFAVFADRIVPLSVPGFTGGKLAETISLSRVLLISTMALGMSAIMGGVLQAKRKFMAFAFAPVLYNAGIIAGIIFFAPAHGVNGVAWGVVMGAGAHLLVQALVAVPSGFGRLAWPKVWDKDYLRLLKLTAPRMASLGVSQINALVSLVIASALPIGSVAVFNLANNLQFVPIGLIGISFALAAFPVFSEKAAVGDMAGLKTETLSTVRKVLFLIIPSMALMLLLRAQAVRVIFGAGEFDWEATIRTADVLGLMVFSLLPQALLPSVTRVFYALQDTRTPFWSAMTGASVNIVLAIFLSARFGVSGLAAAFSIANYTEFILVWFLLRRKFMHLDGKELSVSIGKTVLAAIALFGFGWLIRQWIGTVYPLRTFWQVALQAGLTSFVGIVAFGGVAYLLKVREFSEFAKAMKSKLLKTAKISEVTDLT